MKNKTQNTNVKTSAFLKLIALWICIPFISVSQVDCVGSGSLAGWTTQGVVQTANAGTDFYGNFPLGSPGTGNAIRIGDNTTYPQPFSSATRTFTVTAAAPFLQYYYAMVNLDFPHPPAQAATSAISILDPAGNVIPCTNFQVFAAAGGPPGFQQSTRPQECNLINQCTYPISFLPWQSSIVDLTAFIGQNVTIQLTNAWCAPGVDWGYAYFDAQCVNFSIVQSCTGLNTILTAPPGGNSYLWNTGETTQSIVANTPGNYSCQILPVQGAACAINLNFTTTPFPLPNAAFNFAPAEICEGEQFQFTNNSTVDPGGTITGYYWDFGNGIMTPNGTGNITGTTNTNGTYTSLDHLYPTPGQYDVALAVSTANGCSDTLRQTVTVNPLPTATITGTATVCQGAAPSDIVLTGANGTAPYTFTYTFNGGPNQTITSTGDQAVISVPTTNPGTFTYSLVSVEDQSASVCGQAQTGSAIVTIEPSALGTISGDVSVCKNDSEPVVTFTGSNAAAPFTFTYNINGGAVQTVTSTGNTATVNVPTNTPGTYNYNLTDIQNGGGPTACSQLGNTLVTIEVNVLPEARFSSDIVCEGNQTNFTDESVTAAGTITNWEWDFENDAVVDEILQNPSHQYPQNGTYNANLLVTNSFGCEHDTVIAVEVNPVPFSSFQMDTVCFGDQTNFINNSTIDYGTISYTWNLGDGNTSTDQNPVHLYANPGLYNVTLTSLSGEGCTSDTTLSVEVYEQPTADFTFNNACNLDLLTFQSTAVGNGGTIQQTSWDVNADNINDYNGVNGGHQYTAQGYHDIRQIVITDKGCADTIVQEVTVYALPTANWQALPVCEDASTSFNDYSTVTQVDNDVITQWNWSLGDGNTSTNASPVHAYGEENVYDVELIVITNHGCRDTLEQTVTVWPLPEVDFSPTDVCNGFDTEFQDESTISNDHTVNNNVQWDWDFGDGSNSAVQNPNYIYNTDGVFNATLTVTSNNGCVSSRMLPVTVHPKPQVDFTGINLEGCSPICPEVTSTSLVNNPGVMVDYKWTLSDGRVYEGATPSFSDCYENLTDNTIYYGLELEVTTDKGCVDVLQKSNYITVYHNPLAGFYFNPEAPDIVNRTVEFTNTSRYADTYEWSFGKFESSSLVHPVIEFPYAPNEFYDLELVALTEEGCSDTARSVVEVLDRIIFYVPNTFTPDRDNFNETFQPVFNSGYDPQDFNLLIFNRWGEVMFESNDASVGWDGTYGGDMCRDGTYIWKIEFKETMSDKRHTHTGHVNLLR